MNPLLSERIRFDLEHSHPGSSNSLNQFEQFPEDVQERILDLLLEYTCQSQRDDLIFHGRAAIGQIRHSHFSSFFESRVAKVLDLTDEWEFRRLCELLFDLRSPLTSKYINIGLASTDEEIRETAQEMSKFRHV